MEKEGQKCVFVFAILFKECGKLIPSFIWKESKEKKIEYIHK